MNFKLIKYLIYVILTLIHFTIFAHKEINDIRSLEDQNVQQDIQIQTVPLRITLFSPYTDIDIFPGDNTAAIRNYFLLGFLYSRADYLSGLSISPITHIKKEMFGLQISLINFADEELAGAQLGVINFGNNISGLQLGYVNFSNILNGVQGTLVNISNDVNGVQIGIANIADNTDGAQLGIYSQTSNELRGFQLGIINYANHVKGGQLGIINIANDQTGTSFGFMNFLLKTGQTKLALWYDSYLPINVALKAGSKYFYNKAQISAYPDASNLFDLAFGTGAQYPFKPIWLGAETIVMETQKSGTNIKAFRAQYTLLFGTTVEHDYDLFLGVSYNSPEIFNKSGTKDLFKDLFPNSNYFVSASLGIQYLIKGVPNW